MTILSIVMTALLVQPSSDPTLPLTAVSMEPTPVVHMLHNTEEPSLPGTTRPLHMAELGVPFDSLLSEIKVAEGQFVTKGEVVALLDDRVARAEVRIAEHNAANTAAVDRARVQFNRAKSNLANISDAHASDAASVDELDEVRALLGIAQADLLAAEQDLERAKLELQRVMARHEQYLVRAPYDATVLRVHAEQGVVLSPGEAIIEIATLDRICVDLHMSSKAALDVDEGQVYALELGTPLDMVLPARVRYVEPRIDPTSRTQRVVFEFTNLEVELPIGLLVKPATQVRAGGLFGLAWESD